MKNLTSHPIKILLIDDDENSYISMQNLMCEFTVNSDCELKQTASHADAFRAIIENKYDVYLIDYEFAVKNDFDLLQKTVSVGCRAPIIILAVFPLRLLPGRDDPAQRRPGAPPAQAAPD